MFLEPQTWPYSKLHCCYILTAFNGLLGSDNAGRWLQIWHFMTPLIGRQCFDFVCPKAPSVRPNLRTRSNSVHPWTQWVTRSGYNAESFPGRLAHVYFRRIGDCRTSLNFWLIFFSRLWRQISWNLVSVTWSSSEENWKLNVSRAENKMVTLKLSRQNKGEH